MIRLKKNADTTHETAVEWYYAYGAHITTTHHGDIEIGSVDPTVSKEENQSRMMEAYPRLTIDEIDGLIEMSNSVYSAAQGVVDALDRAVDAYYADDCDAVVTALNEASELESMHGDDPAAQQLRSQLLDEIED